MQAKDLILLMLIPTILIGIVVYTDISPEITGLVIKQEKVQSSILGTYSINPSFKVKMDYDLFSDYDNIKVTLNQIIEECKNRKDDIEQCFKDNAIKFKVNCPDSAPESSDESAKILDDFVYKFNQCLYLQEENVVCRFSLDKREINNRPFDIRLTSDGQTIQADLKEGNANLKTTFIEQGNLLYTDWGNKDASERLLADAVHINVRYLAKNPTISKAFAKPINELSEIEVAKRTSNEFMLYKSSDGVIKFIDINEQGSFGILKKINLPKTKGFVFCAKGSAQLYAYDSSDSEVKLRPIIYKFAVAFPKPPPKPIENLEALDALNASNSAILAWDKSDDTGIKSYSIYYSAKDFADMKIDGIKKDDDILKKSVLNNPIEIKDIDLTKCQINPIGTPCKYAIYNNHLEGNKLYYWASKNKLIYFISDVKDNVEYSYAVTAVDEDGMEIGNDKSVVGNTYILALGKNYKKFTSKDDLAPGNVMELQQVQTAVPNAAELTWKKPERNIDGSPSDDIENFNVYYKESKQPSYAKILVASLEALCNIPAKKDCRYILKWLEQGKIYNLFVTALDKNSNEYSDNADVKSIAVGTSP